MPGLIDAHVHLMQGAPGMSYQASHSPSYTTAIAVGELKRTLDRGFTTVRDSGGTDYGLARAVDEQILEGPTIKFAGRALSPTGGHGDYRGLEQREHVGSVHSKTVVCDGVTEMRKAAREELRRGAHHVKVMVTGGVGSPTDAIDSVQFSSQELEVAVEEAQDAGKYVAAHGYADAGVRRALAVGARSIEHGNLLSEEVLRLILSEGVYLVPTLAAYHWMAREGAEAGAPAYALEKNRDLLAAGLASLETAARLGVKVVFGTDLLGSMRRHQLSEFDLRSEVMPVAEIIRSATSTAAELLQASGEIGTVAPGAFADLLVLRHNPLEDIRALSDPNRSHVGVIKKGRALWKR